MPGFVATDAAMQNMSPEFHEHVPEDGPRLNRPAVPEDSPTRCCSFASRYVHSFVTGETMPGWRAAFGLPSPMRCEYQDMKSKG